MAIDAAARLFQHPCGGMLALFVDYDLCGEIDHLVTWWLALGPGGTVRHTSGPTSPPPFRWAERIFGVRSSP